MIDLLDERRSSSRKCFEPWRQHSHFLYALSCVLLALPAIGKSELHIPGKKRAVRGLEALSEACRVCPVESNLGSEHGELQFDNGPSYLRVICRRAEGNASALSRFIIFELNHSTNYKGCSPECLDGHYES